MTITLTYFDDLSRVEIGLSGYEDGTVRVEQSTNQLFWRTVRGGVELPIVSGVATLNDYDGWTPDLQNFYRTIALDPAAGLVLPGGSGNYASTPDTAVLDITGDIDVRAYVAPTDYSTSVQTIVGKRNDGAGESSWVLYINASGNLNFAWWNASEVLTNIDGPNIVANTGVADGEWIAVRATLDVNNGAGGKTIRLFWAPTLDGPWTQLGSDFTTAGTTAIFSSSANLEVGARDNGTLNIFVGTIGAVEVYNGIDGTVVANPDFAAQDNGDTSFVDAAGRTWTVNGTAEIRGTVLETNSITPDLEGEIWLKVVKYPFLNRPVSCIISGDVSRNSRTGIFDIVGRSVPVAVSDYKSSMQFTVAITTRTLEDARDLDLAFALGETMLLHVPQEDVDGCGPVKAVPGGFIEIGDVTQRRAVPGSRIYQFTLPCVIVAKPGPDVIPTTLIWNTVFNLYGGWEATIAANPTWEPLLATVGSPEDTVVL